MRLQGYVLVRSTAVIAHQYQHAVVSAAVAHFAVNIVIKSSVLRLRCNCDVTRQALFAGNGHQRCTMSMTAVHACMCRA